MASGSKIKKIFTQSNVFSKDLSKLTITYLVDSILAYRLEDIKIIEFWALGAERVLQDQSSLH
jgi:hypothetical protein